MALDYDGNDVFYECLEEVPGTESFEKTYSLHRAAFENNVEQLTTLLKQLPQSEHTQPDPHGNNALHVAALRGNTEAVQLLLDAGLSPATRSSRGWTPLDEACAARAMPAARLLQRRLLADVKAEMKAKRSQLLDSMRAMPDYSLQLKWQLGSSLPGLGMLLRRYAPHDTYTIWKVGDKLRVDGSLMGIDTKNIMPEWKRGHFSLIVDGSPAGIAAAAEAVAAAIAAASAAAEAKRKARQRSRSSSDGGQQQKEEAGAEQQSVAAEAATEASSSSSNGAISSSSSGAVSSSNGAVSSSNSAVSGSGRQQESAADAAGTVAGSVPDEQQFFDAEEGQAGSSAAAAASSGGPRILFLNHVKSSWLDLSADKKALKLEGRGEEEELAGELAAAMERDVDKLRLKPRNFKFAPVRGWLGGNMTEKVEGWKCTVYEATGKLLAVNTSKARLHLPHSATFADYLAAQYEADEVTETLIDPLSPSGAGMMGGGSGKGKASCSSSGPTRLEEDVGIPGATADDYDAIMWNEPAGSSSSSKQRGKGSKKGSSNASASDSSSAGGSGGGRLLRARCWMAQDFPMQLSQLLPLLDVIGTANKQLAKVGKFLSKYSQMDLFPVKLQVPLLLTVYALVSFKAFHPLLHGSAHPPPPDEFFAVPSTYKRKLLSEVMDKAAANMMGLGPDRDYSEGGSVFYGGDEGEEDLMFAAEMEEWERRGEAGDNGELAGGRNHGGGRRAREVRIGSGLDTDAHKYNSNW